MCQHSARDWNTTVNSIYRSLLSWSLYSSAEKQTHKQIMTDALVSAMNKIKTG